jgi:hypothetical protein
MINLSAEVEVALAGTATIPRTEYERWIRGDLRTRARVYALTASHWSRIHPEPSGEQHCRFMADYLIECLLQNPEGDDFLHSGFDAADEIAAWLKHLVKTPDGKAVLTEVAGCLAVAYKAADPTIRNRIETGALEHALESRAVRPFFDSWGTDPILRHAHEHALAWGLAHTDQVG